MYSTLDEEIEGYSSSPGRSHMQEAIRCYHAQSPRAAVVLAWQAAVHDYMGKLVELASHAHTFATERLANHEAATDNSDFRFLLDFERTLPAEARTTLGLISAIEESQLSSVFQERHRCAHPTLDGGNEAYQPTLETARWCIRVVIDAMFAKPALVGAAAREVLEGMLGKPTFPAEVARAIRTLRRSPLNNANRAIVRHVLKYSIQQTLNGEEFDPFFAAFAATRAIHPQVSLQILEDELSSWVVSTNEDSGLTHWIAWLDPTVDLWPLLNDDAQAHLRNHISGSDPDDLAVQFALPHAELRESIAQALQSATSEALVVAATGIDQEYGWELVLDRLADAANFDSANAVLAPLTQRFTHVPIAVGPRLLDIAEENEQVQWAYRLPPLLGLLAETDGEVGTRAQKLMQEVTEIAPQQ
jgi:hypothetical protein